MGLTRYGLPHDSETRFSVSGGAGVKLFAAPWIGVRFDGRVFATFDALACVACAAVRLRPGHRRGGVLGRGRRASSSRSEPMGRTLGYGPLRLWHNRAS